MRQKLLWLLFCCVLLSSASPHPDMRRSYSFILPEGKRDRQIVLASLHNYDVMGIDHKTGAVDLRLNSQEVQELESLSLKLSYKSNAETLISQYMDPQAVRDHLSALADAYPELTQLIKVGKTHEGREILGLVISSDPQESLKPSVLLNGMHHARELMTTEVVSHAAQVLLEGYGRNEDVTRWLDHLKVIVVPQVNPDGNNMVHTGRKMWRKNTRPNGGLFGAKGVDLNRNYPSYWNHCRGSSGSKRDDTYRGPEPASEQETKGMLALIDHYRPVFNISYHSYSELIIYPFGCHNVRNPAQDYFHKVGEEMNAQLENDAGHKGRYQVGTAPELLYSADGVDNDTHWQKYGVYSYTIEVNARSIGFHPDYDTWRDVTVKRQEGAWKVLLDKALQGVVKADVRHNSAVTGGIFYRFYRVTQDRRTQWGESERVKPFQLKEGRLLYQVLEPGEYELVISDAQETELFQKKVEVKRDVPVDLGVIYL